jgi:hypothetical protein
MPSVKRRASKILDEYGAARSELIDKAVVLTDGKAGTVENVWLDELHGLYETNTHERLIFHLRVPANVPTTQFWAVDVAMPLPQDSSGSRRSSVPTPTRRI